MTREEIRQIVWQELQRSLHILLTGVSANADGQSVEDVQNMFAGMSPIQEAPVAFPYGHNAATPDQTLQVVAQIGNSIENRMVISHVDASRPAVNPGEVILYNQYGQVVYLQQGQVNLGSKTANQPFVLGTLVNTFFNNLLTALIAHTHASPGAPPTNITTFENLLTNTVENDSLLSEVVMGE